MTTFFPLTTLPAPYDIVWCRFPFHEDLGNPGPKARPCVVLNVAVFEDDGESEVQVVFGTTQLKTFQRRHDLFVTNAAEMDICGLDKATRFDLDKIAWLPWAEEWFSTLPTYNSPIIGHLSQHATRLLQIELGRRQAQMRLALEEKGAGTA